MSSEPSLQIDLIAAQTTKKVFEKAAIDLAGELAQMHGTLDNLIAALYNTRLSKLQTKLIKSALLELHASQARFFEQYADTVGGAAPENN